MILKITQDEMREHAIKFINKDKFQSILEIGCGTGNFAKQLYMTYGLSNINYIGIDIKPQNISECRQRILDYQYYNFSLLDVTKDEHFGDFLRTATIICSFQVLEHVGTVGGSEDIDVISKIPFDKQFIFSVPNSPYKNEHVRWFEMDGWVNRYSHLLDFKKKITIQNPRKPTKRAFLFNTWRKR